MQRYTLFIFFSLVTTFPCISLEIQQERTVKLTEIDCSDWPLDKQGLFKGIPTNNVASLHTSMRAITDPDTFLYKYTLLTLALSNRAQECATALITQYHADVNKLDEFKLSPLVYALRYKNYYLANLLLDFGAHINLLQGNSESSWGQRSALWVFLTTISNQQYLWQGYYSEQMIWLLRHNASPNTMVGHDTLLTIVLQSIDSDDKIKLIEHVCKSGVDINCRLKGYNNKTILHHAVQRVKSSSFERQILMLYHMFKAGADINALDDYFESPLHKAVQNNEEPATPLCRGADQTNKDCIAYLIYQGANPEIKNSCGKKPIDYTRQPEVKAMLENPKSVPLPETVKAILDSLKVPCEKIP